MKVSKINDNQPTGLEIAVIGMSGRFPGAAQLEEFWDNLKNGVESITYFSDAELTTAGVDPEWVKRPDYVKAKGVLKNAEYFDASFFDYAPKDAEIMDPQIRIFHECVWEALEDAGYEPMGYKGLIGLYAGASPNLYWETLSLFSGRNDPAEQYAAKQLRDKDFLCSRVSYKLNLRGPSVVVDTGCSTSAVAIHQACRAILSGECDLSVAGGITLFLPQVQGYFYHEGMNLSPDGHCRSFDAAAKGMVAGEGAGAVVLKYLEDAIRDRDHIYAVIKGTAVNNDGSMKAGYTALSAKGQTLVMRAAFKYAGIKPESISYIEAQGTAMPVGDLIEFEGLKTAFNSEKKGFCAVGSVKTNIGHLEAAAGVAAFIKTVLAIQNRQIPPSLHYQNPNPQIDFDNSPFYINTRLTAWENERYPLRAGVSSFGIGGTNAHIILEEAPELMEPGPERDWKLVSLSGKTQSALDRISINIVRYLRKNPDVALSDMAYTLHVGRKQFKHRRIAVCSDAENAIALLTPSYDRCVSGLAMEDRSPSFLLSGFSGLHREMGRKLYMEEPAFREELGRRTEVFHQVTGIEIDEALSDAGYNPKEPGNATTIEFSVAFLVEYLFAKLLIKWGIIPKAIFGYDGTELTAACLAEVFSFHDALTLAAFIGKYYSGPPAGPKGKVYFSGIPGTAIAELQIKLGEMKLNPPKIPVKSKLTGTWITAKEAVDPEYWLHVFASNRNCDTGLPALPTDEQSVVVHFGTAERAAKCISQMQPNQLMMINLFPDTGDNSPAGRFLLTKIGELWCAGIKIDWETFYAGEKRHRIPLPTYPFERQRYWIDYDGRNPGNPFALQPLQREMQPLYARPDLGNSYEAPQNEIEAKLAVIWEQLFGIKKVGIDDNFFELGGDSLKATILTAEVHKELNVVIPLKEVFSRATIRELAKTIKDAVDAALVTYLSIDPAPQKDYYPVSSAQMRMYLTSKEGTLTNYNIPLAMNIEGALDRNRFKTAFTMLIRRHESLRTSFEIQNGEVVQRIWENIQFQIENFEAGDGPEIAQTVHAFIRPFDLSRPPLLRAGLIKITDMRHMRHILVFDMHHIITDGISMSILTKEFIDLYEGRELPPLRIQYKDYSEWQNQLFQTEVFKKQESYWLKELEGPIPVLKMPLDFPRPAVRTFEGDTVRFTMDKDQVAKLDIFARKHEVTRNILLFAAYGLLMNQYSGQDDIIIGSLVAGRQHADLENIIGVFMNFLPVRLRFDADLTFLEYLHAVKDGMLSAYENQIFPFEMMVEKTKYRTDPSRNPLFDTMLVFHNEFDLRHDGKEIRELKFSAYEIQRKMTTLDLKLDIFENDTGGLDCFWEYDTHLFTEKTMIRMSEHFNIIVERFLAV